MKYSLTAYCSKQALELADEINLHFKNINEINEIVYAYPNKKFIVGFREETINDILKLAQVYDITIQLFNLDDIPIVKDKIKWFYYFPTQSFTQLNLLINLGAQEIVIGDELIHYCDDLARIKEKYSIEYRINPAVYSTLPYSQAYTEPYLGSWIRPEDLTTYNVIDTLTFWENGDIKREMTLFQVYKRGYWQGPLNMLIKNIPIDTDNYKIKDLTSRANCKLRCLKGYSCNICKNKLKLAELMNKE